MGVSIIQGQTNYTLWRNLLCGSQEPKILECLKEFIIQEQSHTLCKETRPGDPHTRYHPRKKLGPKEILKVHPYLELVSLTKYYTWLSFKWIQFCPVVKVWYNGHANNPTSFLGYSRLRFSAAQCSTKSKHLRCSPGTYKSTWKTCPDSQKNKEQIS